MSQKRSLWRFSLIAARRNQELLAWMNDLSRGHVVEPAQLVYGKAVLLSDGVERVPGTDLVVATFR